MQKNTHAHTQRRQVEIEREGERDQQEEGRPFWPVSAQQGVRTAGGLDKETMNDTISRRASLLLVESATTSFG